VKKAMFMTCLLAALLVSSPILVNAEVAGLIPCKDSAAFNKRILNMLTGV